MSVYGSDKTILLSDPGSHIYRPMGCPGGRYIVFQWPHHNADKTNIWRLNTDGSNPKQLTFGGTDVAGTCSADREWVYYENLTTFQVFRVRIDGGVPEEVPGTRGLSNVPAMGLSSDGRFLVSFKLPKDVVRPGAKIAAGAKIAIVPLDAGPKPEVRYLDADPRLAGQAKFTPDREAVIYIIRDNIPENLWRQPLDGSPGRQITNFKSDGILTYVFSPDGKTLGVMRTHIESDVVLLHDTGSSTQAPRYGPDLSLGSESHKKITK